MAHTPTDDLIALLLMPYCSFCRERLGPHVVFGAGTRYCCVGCAEDHDAQMAEDLRTPSTDRKLASAGGDR